MNRIAPLFLAALAAGAVPWAHAQGGVPPLGLAGQGLSQPGHVLVEARVTPATAKPGELVTLELVVEIEDGWHIYGAAETTGTPTSVTVAERAGLELAGDAEIPAGEHHETFGIVSYWIQGEATLRQQLRVPADAQPGERKLAGRIDYMACTEEFCDPPAQEPFSVTLQVEAGAAAPTEKPPAAVFDPLAIPGAGSKLIVEPAVTPAVARAGETVTLELALEIQDGWHVYGAADTSGTPTSVTITRRDGLEPVGDAVIPDGEYHETSGIVSYWITGEATLRQVLRIPADAEPGTRTLEGRIDYMACTEEFCDPAAQEPFSVTLQIEAGAARAATPSTPPSTPLESDGDENIATMSLGLFLLAAVGWGLFALAMPCTYPMIPITISFFTKQAEQRGGAVLPLALVYGLGIVLMFVLIGVTIGPLIVPFAVHPVTNVVFALAFFVFALALFGMINLQPPAFLMDAANKSSSTGGFVGVFLMGATLVVSSFTCTAPFVGTLLAIGAEGGNIGRVMLGMAVFGTTMALPFVFLSLAPGKINAMPRSGEWMNTLKVFLGFVEVAAALKFLSNADLIWHWEWLSRELFLYLWAGIFGIAALFLLGMIKLKGETGDIGAGRLTGGLAVATLAIYCAYGAAGNRMDWVMTAMAPPYSNRIAAVGEAGFEAGNGELSAGHVIVADDFDTARDKAIALNRKLLINFTGHT